MAPPAISACCTAAMRARPRSSSGAGGEASAASDAVEGSPRAMRSAGVLTPHSRSVIFGRSFSTCCRLNSWPCASLPTAVSPGANAIAAAGGAAVASLLSRFAAARSIDAEISLNGERTSARSTRKMPLQIISE